LHNYFLLLNSKSLGTTCRSCTINRKWRMWLFCSNYN